MEDVEAKKNPSQSVKFQYLASIVVNLISISYGMNCGWTSPSIIQLQSDNSPLASKITLDEVSWIASLSTVGGFIGNFTFGFMTNKFGRKSCLIAMAFPNILAWLLIYFAQNVYYLFAARILTGVVGGGVFVIIPVFLSEIASDNVRGTLGSMLMFSYNTGVLFSFILGNYCNYFTIPKVVVALTGLFVSLFVLFPESPMALVKKNKIQAAEKSIRFYQNTRGNEHENEAIQAEIEKLKATLTTKTERSCENSFNWRNLLTVEARKALMIGIYLSALNQFSGCCAMLFYIAYIFSLSGSHLTPNMSAILVGTIQLIGALVSTQLVDRAGRKFLFAISSTGTALGFIVLGTYTMLKSWQYDIDAYNWIPVASFSFVIFIASWAVLTLNNLVIAEIMPENIKDFGVTFSGTLAWIFTFISIKYLPFLIQSLTFHGSMYLFAGVCLFSTLFITVYVPETKGKSYEQIQASLK